MQITKSLWSHRVHKHIKSDGLQVKKNPSFPPRKSPLFLVFRIVLLLMLIIKETICLVIQPLTYILDWYLSSGALPGLMKITQLILFYLNIAFFRNLSIIKQFLFYQDSRKDCLKLYFLEINKALGKTIGHLYDKLWGALIKEKLLCRYRYGLLFYSVKPNER